MFVLVDQKYWNNGKIYFTYALVLRSHVSYKHYQLLL